MEKIELIIDKIRDAIEKINGLSFLNKTPSKKFIVITFTLIIALLAALSLATVISEKRGETQETTDISSKELVASVVEEKDLQEIKGNFLLVLTEDGTEKIELLSLMRLDSQNKTVSISFVSPKEVTTVNGVRGSMQEHLEKGGINELVWSVGEFAGISIERYIIGDEQNFIDFMKSLGEIEIDVKEKISYTHRGIPIIIEEGLQGLSADIMLKYFVYLCENYTDLPEKLVEAMVLFGKKMFDSSEDAYLDASFNKMIKNFDTDISVVDFTNYRKAVKGLASSENPVNIIIEPSPSNLK